MDKEGMSRMAVWIPRGVHAEAIRIAKLKGMTLMEYASEAMQEKNEKEGKDDK